MGYLFNYDDSPLHSLVCSSVWWNWLQGQFVAESIADDTIETQDSTSSAEEEERGSSSNSADVDEDDLPEEGFEDIVGEEDDDGFEMMED